MRCDALIMATVTDPSGEVDSEPITLTGLPGGGVELGLWDGQTVVLAIGEVAAVVAVSSAAPVVLALPSAAA